MSKLALVVDDSMLIRHTVCRFFEDRGFVVESASNGAEALRMLDRVHPDLIITDLQMPKMNGHQFIQALQTNPETADIPILILACKKQPHEPAAFSPDYVIYKDIDVVTQLARALEKLAGAQPECVNVSTQGQGGLC